MLRVTFELGKETGNVYVGIDVHRKRYCHPNTVRHRLRRIKRQTGRSLADPRSSAELFVALDALRTLRESAGDYA